MTTHDDTAQRVLALQTDQSFIVQAPAGSGKTELLIQRYLALLATVNQPEEILAITFTKKAANEMRTRLIDALTCAKHDPEPESAHKKKTWQLGKRVLLRDQSKQWHLESNPNQLRIQTIDSLCAYLTKQLPLTSHFGSEPRISNDPEPLYELAVTTILSHIEEHYEWSNAIAKLLSHLDNDLNKLLKLFIEMLKRRDQWLPYLHLDQDNQIKVELEHHLVAVIEDMLATVQQSLPDTLKKELFSLAHYAASHLPNDSKNQSIRSCLNIHSLTSSITDRDKWLGVVQLLLTDDKSTAQYRRTINKSIGFPAPSESKNAEEKKYFTDFKARMMILLSTLSDDTTLLPLLHELKFLPDPVIPEHQWDVLQSLFYLLKVMTAQLRVVFQEYGEIDFIENALAAIQALGDPDQPTDLALALDYQIRHILVDEFQDTSLTQFKLLEKLVMGWQPDDGRTLFVVGDPMQSIYRFREAEVGIFIRMQKQGIAHLDLTPLTLSVNFRSTSNIVEWNNRHFTHLFPPANDIATGAVIYSPSISPHITVPIHESYIHIDATYATQPQQKALQLAEQIKSIQTTFPQESIAILVRSRSNLINLIPALKSLNLRYHAVEIDRLSSRQIIQDLFALTRALIHPADRIAWLAVLRAPWCGLALSDLHQIAAHDSRATMMSLIQQSLGSEKLTCDGNDRLQRLYPIMLGAIQNRDRDSFRTWIEKTWLALGGPITLTQPEDYKDVQAYFSLMDNIDSDKQPLTIERLNEHINHLFALGSSHAATIHLMTIHNAKGLEFDTVIIPALESKTPPDDKRLMLWMDRPLANSQTALMLAPLSAAGEKDNPIYTFIHRQMKQKLHYEVDRLLYVAATRAKKRLILSYTIDHSTEPRMDHSSFLYRCWPLIKTSLPVSDTTPNPVIQEDIIKSARQARYIKRIHSTWVHPIAPQNTPSTQHQSPPGFNRPQIEKQIAGVIAHRLFQQLSTRGIAWWTNQSPSSQNQWLRHQMIREGLPLSVHHHYAKQLHEIAQTMLNDPQGQWILASHIDSQSEIALTYIDNQQPVSVVIDRTFIDETGTRWIIDYKTSSPDETTTLSHFLEKEIQAYQQQLRSYIHAFRLKEDRPIQAGLYFPTIPAWRTLDI